MTDEAFEKYELVWTAVHNLVDRMLSGEAGAEDIRDKLTNEFRFWKRSGHDIAAASEMIEQPEQEPVAWMKASDIEVSISLFEEDGYVPLYTTPPQRKPLTDEDLKKIWYAMRNIMGWYSFQEIARAIEAAHGIKE